MDHVAIDLGGTEPQICIRRPNNDVHLERRIPTAKVSVPRPRVDRHAPLNLGRGRPAAVSRRRAAG
jgi:hypothetical protein